MLLRDLGPLLRNAPYGPTLLGSTHPFGLISSIYGHAEAQAVALGGRLDVTTERRPADTGAVVPAATAEHAALAIRGTGRIAHSTTRILTVPVRTPFHYVAMHVVKAKWVRLLLLHLVRVLFTFRICILVKPTISR